MDELRELIRSRKSILAWKIWDELQDKYNLINNFNFVDYRQQRQYSGKQKRYSGKCAQYWQQYSRHWHQQEWHHQQQAGNSNSAFKATRPERQLWQKYFKVSCIYSKNWFTMASPQWCYLRGRIGRYAQCFEPSNWYIHSSIWWCVWILLRFFF